MKQPKRKKRRIRYIYRSAITGETVTRSYADKHPKTAVRERIDSKKRK